MGMRVPDKKAAKARVESWLRDQYRFAANVPVIADERTVERDFGWVFYLRGARRALGRPSGVEPSEGNYAPVAIHRADGAITLGQQQK